MQGRRFVYLHGFCSSPGSRKAQFFKARFAECGIELEIPDLNRGPDGRGEFRRLTITRQIEQVRALVAELDARDASAGRPPSALTLIGSSMGGYVATLYALASRAEAERNGESSDQGEESASASPAGRVERMLLMAPAFGFVTRHRRLQGEAFFEEWRVRGFQEFDHYGYDARLPLDYGMVQDALAWEERSVAGDLRAFVVQGLYDETVPPETALAYQRGNRAAEVLLLHSDHSLTDATETIWRRARSFLDLPAP